MKKRFLTVIAIAIVSAMLVACGEKGSTAADPSDNVSDSTPAVTDDNADAATTPETTTSETEKELKVSETMVVDIVGTWECSSQVTGVDGIKKITLRADATCNIDGKEYTWEYESSVDGDYNLAVLDNGKKIYQLWSEVAFEVEIPSDIKPIGDRYILVVPEGADGEFAFSPEYLIYYFRTTDK